MAMESDSPLLEESPDVTHPPHRDQYLFLLEFFVHKITSERLGKFNEMFYVPTTVTLNFLGIQDDSIEITPVDQMFLPLSGIPGDSENFFAGRSVLFAIPEKLVVTKSTELRIKLTVRKKMPDEIRPDVFVGEGELDMSEEFAGLRKEMLQCWHRDVPPPKTFEGPIDLFYDEEVSGSALVLVRISGFGQSIVTEIDAPPADSATSFVFKGDRQDDKTLSYKCKIVRPSKMDFSKHSEDNLRSCEVCIPKRRTCLPCRQPDGARTKIGDSREQACEKPGVREEKPVIEDKGMIRSSRGSPTPCGKAVVLKVSGLLDCDGNKKPTVTVASELSGPDPGHDIFVLRIGKKGLVGADEKSDLQLEMRTPKGPERRPPIRYETREAQTEAETKEVKKKGKGKKK